MKIFVEDVQNISSSANNHIIAQFQNQSLKIINIEKFENEIFDG